MKIIDMFHDPVSEFYYMVLEVPKSYDKPSGRVEIKISEFVYKELWYYFSNY